MPGECVQLFHVDLITDGQNWMTQHDVHGWVDTAPNRVLTPLGLSAELRQDWKALLDKPYLPFPQDMSVQCVLMTVKCSDHRPLSKTCMLNVKSDTKIWCWHDGTAWFAHAPPFWGQEDKAVVVTSLLVPERIYRTHIEGRCRCVCVLFILKLTWGVKVLTNVN